MIIYQLNGGLKGTNCWTPVCTTNCYPTEDNTNNFIALRSLGGKGTGDNTLYAEFKTGDLTDGDVVFDSTPVSVLYFSRYRMTEYSTNLMIFNNVIIIIVFGRISWRCTI